MRIVGGTLGGRILQVKRFTERPTMERTREALFNILDNRLDYPATPFLDLYAGTGAIAFEAISRGARRVVCVESNPIFARQIRENCQALGVSNLEVLTLDALRFIARYTGEGHTLAPFGLIFADPPYDDPALPQLPSLILKSSLLSPGGTLIIEHPAARRFNATPAPFEVRHYGKSYLSFFHHDPEAACRA